MPSRSVIKTAKKQKGIALLILVVVIVLAFVSHFVSGLSINRVKVEQKKQTQIALKKAKQALLGYAASFPELTPAIRGPGYLPCPDLDNNGSAGVNDCKTLGVSNVGRLPWINLGIPELRDGSNESLWYAVSENFDYSNSPTINKINTATTGNITVRDQNNIIYDGTTINAVVAVIIAPGEALTRDDGVVQDRSAANINAAINYLDNHIASGEDNATFQQGVLGGGIIDGFIQGEIKNAADDVIVNDQLIVITYGEIMEQIHKRVSREIRNVINSYLVACDAYPEASVFNPTKASFDSAAIAPPNELREGHLPLDTALPTGWGGVCGLNTAPVPPPWLAAEGWHSVTYYAFSYQNAPPANGLACGSLAPVVNPPCMIVNNTNPLINNAQAIIVFAGRDITGNRPSVTISDYFEGENNDLDGTYDAGEVEDYVSVVTP